MENEKREIRDIVVTTVFNGTEYEIVKAIKTKES